MAERRGQGRGQTQESCSSADLGTSTLSSLLRLCV